MPDDPVDPPPTPHEAWTEGEFCLISADNVSFRVPSRTLFWASNNLADAADVSGGSSAEKVVRFTDPELESSSTIDRFLNLAVKYIATPSTQSQAPGHESDDDVAVCREIHRLVQFLHKYDCAPLLRLLQLTTVRCLEEARMNPLRSFVIGSVTDSPSVCELALQAADSADDNQPKGYRDERSMRGLDPGTIPLPLWKLIYPAHSWALTAAWSRSTEYRNCSVGRHQSRDPMAVARLFKALVRGADHDA
ncbi:hypothetical protein A1Q1_04614 [Trichosporon asahii var. asahii CBS 2479]|uniref:BTB domain-containing protein n=1 Tax=Trichosporon asahii var. asahii (strain ATCC 90039 / CBS 2479 / JCM 2466 / KCTC 7840 / NBRC 103889/ NCYC 2677 / UAMH 7654) TaxID=1186058 RepID=J6FB63_TRIAS|nr:hypothetical protein A1Q1_04614 [Trichosporon asahii var. asahii CBS 2479]EJT52402.1 hypothetical protein A1Q1_04614 [Trichosporon asahii var. asahii CBS 2479]